MDTSKEYIEMCRNRWVQDLWEPKVGDVTNKGIILALHRHFTEKKRYFYYVTTNQESGLYSYDLTWLPRQDQLQDMVREDTDYHALMKFDTWVFTLARVYDDKIIGKFSMEQLWLAFVMHELHGKKWDGEDWS